MKVLVTGSKGFIGLNLVRQLQAMDNLEVVEFDRSTRWEALENEIEEINFIYHLAGEVDPKISDEGFRKGNAGLTNKLINLIESKNRSIPIFTVSSIHAGLQKNIYGKTKREAEVFLEEYSARNKVNVWICRLPHVFGEGCKPNYNSVISTWMYNRIRDKEIVVFDRSIPMTYVYVQDVISEFIEYLGVSCDKGVITYLQPQQTYATTLGEVVDFIDEFSCRDSDYLVKEDGFKKKLFLTFLDYVNKKDI